jgi:heat shock 70kDa protein 1/2/6/8
MQKTSNQPENNFTINPDEAMAYGAAVQAAILTNVYCSHIQSIQLFEILPLSLGTDTGRLYVKHNYV